MKRFLKMLGVGGLALAAWSIGSAANADDFTGLGDGTSWEDPLNWALGAVPLNNSIGVDGMGTNTTIGADFQVVFDADTWAFLTANHAPAADPPVNYLQSATEYRIQRLLVGDSLAGATNGTHSLTLDQGDGNFIRVTSGNSAVFGGRADKVSTLNVLSGTTNIENNQIRIGAAGVGIVNVVGGELILGRGGLELGFGAAGGTGSGTLNVMGGSLTTRGVATIGPTGTFDVVGSAATVVGIGSHASVDGEWIQQAGGVLRAGLDAGGVTSILIDDVDDDGAGAQGNVTFDAGSILDPYDAGSANNAWTTVMTWEGTLTDNGLALSAAADTAGWEMQIVGSELQVRNPSFPDPVAGIVGDFNGDMLVDCADIDEYIGMIGSAATVRPELDLTVDGTIDLADVTFLVENHVVTQPNGLVGTFLGDLNCDGAVNVLGDAFILVGSLNNSATSYSQGDINLDGLVNVLGDAFALVANLGNSNAQ